MLLLEEKEEIVEALRQLIIRIERRGVRSIEASMQFETIEVPPVNDWKEYRTGPRFRMTLLFDWADTEPADIEIGEKSIWSE